MKKIIAFMLLVASFIAVCSVANISNAQEENGEASADTAVAELFAKYYNDGRYTKNSKIYIDDNSQELKEEIIEYFHAKLAELEKTTYYSKDALWLSREDGTYSYYGTAYEGDVAVGVTHGTALEAYKAPANPSVVLSGVNQNSMEEYYCTLNDFVEGVHTSSHNGTDADGNNNSLTLNELWTEKDGVYYNVDADVLNGYRLFTAPLWLDTPESKNYISFSLATLEEVGSDLVMKLWTDVGDVTKLTSTETLDYAEQTYYLFSEASIHGHVWVEKTIEPTCVSTGERYQECECGEREYLETLSKVALEEAIDGENSGFYDGATSITGTRSKPILTQETYVRLGEKGIYVYLYSTDNSKSWAGSTATGMGNAHTEYYFTLGQDSVLDNSFSVHLYYEGKDNLRTYTYNSTTNVVRDNNLKKYCYYSMKLISEENGVATIAYELYVDYSYFGLTQAPESLNVQTRVGAGYKTGSGYPALVNTVSSGDYKVIDNYFKVENPEIFMDAKKDAKYDSFTPLTGSRKEASHEVYAYFGEKGIYIYQVVTDKTVLSSNTRVQLYLTTGTDALTKENAFGIYYYQNNGVSFRPYYFDVANNKYVRDDKLTSYCQYTSKVIEEGNGYTKYAYEVFVDYSYFGLTEAPETIKIFAVARINTGGAVAFGTSTSGTDNNIETYVTIGKNGLVK